jgi:predicted NBD/HSP70 family sugar kinase
MSRPLLRASHGLLLYGQQIAEGALSRRDLLRLANVPETTFRSAARDLGGTGRSSGTRFFESPPGGLRFGPSAGLVLAVSVGSTSLRAAIVDANGALHHRYEATPQAAQSMLPPGPMLERIRAAISAVLEQAFEDPALLSGDRLPLLGLAVTWATPIDAAGHSLGSLLEHPSWRIAPLKSLVANRLRAPHDRSSVLRIAAACAIADAWRESRKPEAPQQAGPRLNMVVRLAGTTTAASVIVDPPNKSEEGVESGFLTSRTIGGVDHLAGEIAHLPVDLALVEQLNRGRPHDLGKLTPRACSCGAPASAAHLENFISTHSVAVRLKPGSEWPILGGEVEANPDREPYRRALSDVGTLLGGALTGPSAMLNPAAIALVGPLALPPVRQAVESRLHQAQLLGTLPEVRLFGQETDRFLAVQGAGLAVLRRWLFRRFGALIGGPIKQHGPRIEQLTIPLRRQDWQSGSLTGRG